MKKLIATLAVVGCLIGGVAPIVQAQGLTIFSGVRNRDDILSHSFDFQGRPGNRDRYRLNISGKKLDTAVTEIVINYPEYYDGRFDTNKIEVLYGKESKNTASISEIAWNKEDNNLHIYLEETIEADNPIEIKLSNVRNPRFGGTYYFHAQVLSPGDVPLPRYIGTWILSINR